MIYFEVMEKVRDNGGVVIDQRKVGVFFSELNARKELEKLACGFIRQVETKTIASIETYQTKELVHC